MMRRLLDFFGSVRLTLGVLLVLAAVAVGGTLWPVEQVLEQGAPVQRYDLYYQAWWFRALLGVLAINLAVCTWRTVSRTLGVRQRLVAQIAKGLAPGADGRPLPSTEAVTLTARLTACGYRVTPAGTGLLGQRRAASRWAV